MTLLENLRVTTLVNFEPGTRLQRFLIVSTAILLFIAVPMYQATRQPVVGDSDIVRIGLVMLNRFEASQFEGDLTMQAGEWWPAYNPGYMAVIGVGYQVIGNYEVELFVLTLFSYVSLLAGFYCLGRKYGLPYTMSLALAFMTGLYVTGAQALSWTGLRLEMATPRNLYLAVFPWILCLGLHLYSLSRQRLWHWILFAIFLGLLTFLHPISGGNMLAISGMMLLIGWLKSGLKLSYVIVFSMVALPFLVAAGTDVSPHILPEGNGDLETVVNRSGGGFVYFSVARANLFFYRIPDWGIPILLYGSLTLLLGLALWWIWHKRHERAANLWLGFGLVQFAGALLMLPVDWLTLYVAVEWGRRVRAGQDTPRENMIVFLLASVCFLALVVSAVLSRLGTMDALPLAGSLARALQRGGIWTYPAVAMMAVVVFWYRLRDLSYWDQFWYLISAVAVVVVGFHQAEYERLPGTWLPFDYWIYLGVLVLIVWSMLDRLRSLRYGIIAALIVQAGTRSLAAPADVTLTILAGILMAVTHALWPRLHQPSWKTGYGVGVLSVVALVAFFPVAGGSSLASASMASTYRALLANWSRRDRIGAWAPLYSVGTWIRGHTAPESKIMALDGYLRYWSRRPMTVALYDYRFFQLQSDTSNWLRNEGERARMAFRSTETLMALARENQVDYVVISTSQGLVLPENEAELLYEDQWHRIYELNPVNK